MSDLSSILSSYLDDASAAEKKIFFQALIFLASIDGKTDEEEVDFIIEAAKTHRVKNLLLDGDVMSEEMILDGLKIIKNRHLALELIREMCILAHVDNVFSEEEVLFITKVGLAMGIEVDKIEKISNWIIDRIIWMEQARYIFEEIPDETI